MQSLVRITKISVAGLDYRDVAQTQSFCNILLVDQGFNEKHICIDENDRNVPVNHGGKMQKHDRFGPKAGNQSKVGQRCPCRAQDIRCAVMPEAGVERCHLIRRQMACRPFGESLFGKMKHGIYSAATALACG